MFFHGEPFEVPDIYTFNGREVIRLCAIALTAVRNANNLKAHAIFQSIVLSRTYFMLEYTIYEMDWDMYQEQFAHECESYFAAERTEELLIIAQRRITHKRKKERQTKITIDDMRLSALFSDIFDVQSDFEEFLLDQFATSFESPNTS